MECGVIFIFVIILCLRVRYVCRCVSVVVVVVVVLIGRICCVQSRAHTIIATYQHRCHHHTFRSDNTPQNKPHATHRSHARAQDMGLRCIISRPTRCTGVNVSAGVHIQRQLAYASNLYLSPPPPPPPPASSASAAAAASVAISTIRKRAVLQNK